MRATNQVLFIQQTKCYSYSKPSAHLATKLDIVHATMQYSSADPTKVWSSIIIWASIIWINI